MAVLNTVRALTTLVRPGMLPLIWLAVSFGFMVAHWEAGEHLRGLRPLGFALAAWSLGHIGTMWLNAARDQDQGPVAFGRSVSVPPYTAKLGFLALFLTIAIAIPAGPIIAVCAACLALLSVLYSHPRTAWKGHPVGGPFINVFGYGLITPFAGLTAGHGMVSVRTVWIFLLLALSMAGLFFAAQAFQQEEDRGRGDRTLVATHGPGTVLFATRACFGAVALLATIGTIIGWYPRACLWALPLVFWIDRHLLRWRADPTGGSPAHTKTLLRRLIVLLAAIVLAATTEHLADMLRGEQPAGRNTAQVPVPWFVLDPSHFAILPGPEA